MIRQRTLKSVVTATGVGLHGGRKVTLTLRPAAPDTGIVFHRVDLDPPLTLPADPYAVCDTRMCSGLEQGGHKVGTVEHLMSALAGLGIDNLHVDVDAPEIPILDGSSAPFVFLLQSAGIEEQRAAKKFLRVKKAVEYVEGDKWVRLEPYDASAWRSRSCSTIPRSTAPRPGSRSISPVTPTYATSRARAPSASCRTSSSCRPTGWRSAAAWRMRS